jgi:hypothetical protein
MTYYIGFVLTTASHTEYDIPKLTIASKAKYDMVGLYNHGESCRI